MSTTVYRLLEMTYQEWATFHFCLSDYPEVAK